MGYTHKVCLILSSVGFEIKIVTQNVNRDTIKILYHANCESVIKFGIIFWVGNSKIQSVFVAQKRNIETICNLGFRD